MVSKTSMSNLFQEERLRYQPRLPLLLAQIEKTELVRGEKIDPHPSVRSFFSKTSGRSIIQFKIADAQKRSPLRIGVVLSGGQAPGGHNVIVGLYDALKKMHPASHLIGFLGGPSGILTNQYRELDQEILACYRNTGGFDMIGSGRTKIETPEQFKTALKTCTELNLGGLLIIGGDDSNTNAALLAEYFLQAGSPICVIGAPKTIDGDLKNRYIETPFGFDTASKIYSEMIGNICRDALSAKKYTHFIRLMGRSASHVALECALQTHPNITLIGEEIAQKQITLKEVVQKICDMITQRAVSGKNYGVLLIPEGLVEFIPEMRTLIRELNQLLSQERKDVVGGLSKEASDTFHYLPKEISQQLLLERDPHGNVQVSHIATDQLLIHLVKERLKSTSFKGKFTPVGHFFGYEGRCGYPSNFDTHYCYALGFTAAALFNAGLTGYMCTLQKLVRSLEEWEPVGIPLNIMMGLEERYGKTRSVINKALVDLEGEPFKFFAAHREAWALEDHYSFPGPIQFAGPSQLCDATTYTLKLEHPVTVPSAVS